MQRVLNQNIGVGIFVHLPTRQKRRLLIEVPKPVQTTGGWCNAKPDPKKPSRSDTPLCMVQGVWKWVHRDRKLNRNA
jgi:hypothetical protein